MLREGGNPDSMYSNIAATLKIVTHYTYIAIGLMVLLDCLGLPSPRSIEVGSGVASTLGFRGCQFLSDPCVCEQLYHSLHMIYTGPLKVVISSGSHLGFSTVQFFTKT